MILRLQAANAFVRVYEFLCAAVGAARAIADRALQAARRHFLEAMRCMA